MRYSIDGLATSMKEMRRIAELHVGAVAYHVPVTDIVKILREQNITVREIVPTGAEYLHLSN